MELQVIPERKSEKFGWVGGWLGSYIWLLFSSVIWLVQGKVSAGLVGLFLFGLSAATILFFTPWRHPKTPFWKLLIPIYLLLFGALVLAVSTFGVAEMGLSWWSLLTLLPIFIPFATLGRKTWDRT